ncbi:hypothetical protein J6590_001721 [Homalodisca vitripennis]|nr:hypothetical protein J6590_001721 [Homalodisca vitripennis]
MNEAVFLSRIVHGNTIRLEVSVQNSPILKVSAGFSTTSALGEISSAPSNFSSITYEKRLPASLGGRPTAPYPNAAPVEDVKVCPPRTHGHHREDTRQVEVLSCSVTGAFLSFGISADDKIYCPRILLEIRSDRFVVFVN